MFPFDDVIMSLQWCDTTLPVSSTPVASVRVSHGSILAVTSTARTYFWGAYKRNYIQTPQAVYFIHPRDVFENSGVKATGGKVAVGKSKGRLASQQTHNSITVTPLTVPKTWKTDHDCLMTLLSSHGVVGWVSGSRLNIKTVFPGMGIPMWHLYIETAPRPDQNWADDMDKCISVIQISLNFFKERKGFNHSQDYMYGTYINVSSTKSSSQNPPCAITLLQCAGSYWGGVKCLVSWHFMRWTITNILPFQPPRACHLVDTLTTMWIARTSCRAKNTVSYSQKTIHCFKHLIYGKLCNSKFLVPTHVHILSKSLQLIHSYP